MVARHLPFLIVTSPRLAQRLRANILRSECGYGHFGGLLQCDGGLARRRRQPLSGSERPGQPIDMDGEFSCEALSSLVVGCAGSAVALLGFRKQAGDNTAREESRHQRHQGTSVQIDAAEEGGHGRYSAHDQPVDCTTSAAQHVAGPGSREQPARDANCHACRRR